MNRRGRVLVLTVGTGSRDDLEGTLIQPILKSVARGDWTEVVLLPSQVTEAFAASIRKRLSDQPFRVRIKPLPESGAENDADRCLGHFDAVIADLQARRLPADSIAADFTRGTKAMSAALVLAAVGRGIPRLRYIGGGRDRRGMVRPGQEEVRELGTTYASGRRLLEEASGLLRHGDFAAVCELLPDPDASNTLAVLRIPPMLAGESAALRRRAAFLAAWDRLDYRRAAESGAALGPKDRARVTWVRRLADRPEQSNHSAMACWLRVVACDLLQNGRRRIEDGHFEDALVRAYRTREIIGQFLLFDRGVDTSAVKCDLPEVKRLRERLRPREQDFGTRGDHLTAPRELAARLLKEFERPLGKRLLQFDNKDSGRILKGRNTSILIHGFSMKAPADPRRLRRIYDDLDGVLRGVAPETGELLDRVRGLLPLC